MGRAVWEPEPAVCLPCTAVNSAQHHLWCLHDGNPRTLKTHAAPAGVRGEGDLQIGERAGTQ